MVSSVWRIEQFAEMSVDSPNTWQRASAAVHREPDPDEAEVMRAIDAGLIAPVMLVAAR